MEQKDKIAFIVPNDELGAHVKRVLKHQVESGEVVVTKINILDMEQEGRRLMREGVSAVIARGGTYTDLKQCIKDIPVIRLKMSASDILPSLNIARQSYKKIYLILHESTVFDFETWGALMNVSLNIKRYTSIKTLRDILNTIEYDDDTVVVGSGVCTELLEGRNIHKVEIVPQDASNVEVYEIARNMAEQMREEIRRVNLLESLLYAVGDGIIVIDSSGQILNFNRKSEEIFGVSARRIVGKNIRDVMVCVAFDKYLGNKPFKPLHSLITVNHKSLSLQMEPFSVYKDEEQFIITLKDVTKIQELEQSIRRKLTKKGLVTQYTFEDILTNNEEMKNLIEKAKIMTSIDGSVLIFGESGTGKELFAQSIHNAGPRSGGPFVAVNCAALTESLLESELFGYVAGAFTGAKKEGKAGLFELAHGGTIFLDEINSMSLALQAKILRVLEQKEVMRIGSDYVIPLDVRIIAATNEKLRESVKHREFRQDLYFRLNTFELRIPPLRERRDDVLLLFKHYVSQYKGIPEAAVVLEGDFEKQLEMHDWLGNVREVKSTALRYCAFDGDNKNHDILDVWQSADDSSILDSDMKIDLSALNKTVEALVIQNLLDKKLTKNEIAKMLGISRQALFNKISKLKDQI